MTRFGNSGKDRFLAGFPAAWSARVVSPASIQADAKLVAK